MSHDDNYFRSAGRMFRLALDDARTKTVTDTQAAVLLRACRSPNTRAKLLSLQADVDTFHNPDLHTLLAIAANMAETASPADVDAHLTEQSDRLRRKILPPAMSMTEVDETQPVDPSPDEDSAITIPEVPGWDGKLTELQALLDKASSCSLFYDMLEVLSVAPPDMFDVLLQLPEDFFGEADNPTIERELAAAVVLTSVFGSAAPARYQATTGAALLSLVEQRGGRRLLDLLSLNGNLYDPLLVFAQLEFDNSMMSEDDILSMQQDVAEQSDSGTDFFVEELGKKMVALQRSYVRSGSRMHAAGFGTAVESDGDGFISLAKMAGLLATADFMAQSLELSAESASLLRGSVERIVHPQGRVPGQSPAGRIGGPVVLGIGAEQEKRRAQQERTNAAVAPVSRETSEPSA